MIYSYGNNSYCKTQDLFDDLPKFMYNADVVFTDLPYNQNLLTNYNNRKGVKISKNNTKKFDDFLKQFFKQIKLINPKQCFVEIGKQKKDDVILYMQKMYRYVIVYKSTYYKRSECYIIHGVNEKIIYDINGLDEKDIINYICKNVEFKCIADLCMGTGLVGYYAHKYGKSFVGIELNDERLQKLEERIKNGNCK